MISAEAKPCALQRVAQGRAEQVGQAAGENCARACSSRGALVPSSARMSVAVRIAAAKESVARPIRPICSPGTTATRRVLPWRARRGERADPYRVWLSEIMLQQTTVKAVAPYYARFLARWPTVEALAAAQPRRRAARLGRARLLRARPQSACLRAGGGRAARRRFSRRAWTRLRALPGIGDYTAAAIAAIAFDAPAVPVDGNVERVVTRLFAVEEELPAAKPRSSGSRRRCCRRSRAGDFAQALMDLGATICSPKRPACALCPWNEPCVARARGDQETFPRKAPKREGKLRRGAAFVVLRADGRVLLRSAAGKGPARRHDRSAGQRLGARFRCGATRLRAAPRFREAEMAQAAGRRAAMCSRIFRLS